MLAKIVIALSLMSLVAAEADDILNIRFDEHQVVEGNLQSYAIASHKLEELGWKSFMRNGEETVVFDKDCKLFRQDFDKYPKREQVVFTHIKSTANRVALDFDFRVKFGSYFLANYTLGNPSIFQRSAYKNLSPKYFTKNGFDVEFLNKNSFSGSKVDPRADQYSRIFVTNDVVIFVQKNLTEALPLPCLSPPRREYIQPLLEAVADFQAYGSY